MNQERRKESKEWVDIFFGMGKTLKEKVSEAILREIEVYERTGLSNEEIQKKLVTLLRRKIDEEPSRDSEITSSWKVDDKNKTAKEKLISTTMWAPIRAASKRAVEVLEQCIYDLEDTSLEIKRRISLCRTRLEMLSEED